MINVVELWVAMGIVAKLVLLGLFAMVAALPILSVKLARRGEGARALGAIALSAPLLGAFGTVVGLINASAYLAQQESVPLPHVAAGVGEALVTTSIGLLIAIAAVWLRVAFEHRSSRSDQETVVAQAVPDSPTS